MLADSMRQATRRHNYGLKAFVFMPEHVHLLVLPGKGASTISALLTAIKRPFSYGVTQLLIQSRSRLLEQLTTEQRPGVSTFRFWQEGPGYDRNISDPATLQLVIDYIHENPVKRRLCQRAIDWKWSSARRLITPQSVPDDDIPELVELPQDWAAGGPS